MPTFNSSGTPNKHAGAYQDWYRYLRSQAEPGLAREEYQPLWLQLAPNALLEDAAKAVDNIASDPKDSRGTDKGKLVSFVENYEKALWRLYGATCKISNLADISPRMREKKKVAGGYF